MPTLIMTKGLPGSGKTTWAKEQLTRPGIARVNKDDLRRMLHNGIWNPKNETFVKAVRDFIVNWALQKGIDVIVDDTNFAPQHEVTMRDIAGYCGAQFEVKDFTNVPLNVCLQRDQTRPLDERVGQDVIVRMYRQYLKAAKPAPPPVAYGVPEAVICDIDGTVAMGDGRGFYDWDKVDGDKPRFDIIAVVKRVASGRKLIFMSGRKDLCREKTEKWLKEVAGFEFCARDLLMRRADDDRRDSIVKRELYDEWISGKYNVVAVFDDRPQVLNECWRPLGLPVFDVGDGLEF